jgi:hypothetical protein
VNEGLLHYSKEIIVLLHSKHNKPLFIANDGSAVLMEKTHGFITTSSSGNVQEMLEIRGLARSRKFKAVIFVDSMKYVTTTADTCYTTLDLQLKLAP